MFLSTGNVMCGNIDPASAPMTLKCGVEDRDLPQPIGKLRIFGLSQR